MSKTIISTDRAPKSLAAYSQAVKAGGLALGVAGVLLLAIGGFGYFIVTAPPAVKLMCAAALLYALARAAWGFWKA
jgi:glucose dehydrogenase